ncbi:hypothetical protein ACIQTW_13165 [Paenarthrobacter sp. NPDC090517]|uniref:hypothetical protein n=1 Tax=Paenarthrobacter sp. NPDC090517 TaxID=3364381 RepID=UPI00381030CC
MPEDDKPSPRFLTIEQVAEELATSEVQIRSMPKTGQLIQDAYRQVSERIAAGNLEEDAAS